MYNSIILPHNLFISQTSEQDNIMHKAIEPTRTMYLFVCKLAAVVVFT